MPIIISVLKKLQLKWPVEMANLSFEHILLSLIFTLGGTVGGWAVTGKLAGEGAALSFLQIGVVVVVLMSSAQTVFFLMGKKRLIYRLLFNISFAFGIVWFMLCLVLPILWVQSIGEMKKIALFLFLLIICFDNLIVARKQFDTKWVGKEENFLKKYYNIKRQTIDWPPIVTSMNFSVTLNVRGIPERMNHFVSVALILSMVVGLSLRNAFPTFSFFAWGIPSCLVISIFMQMIGLGIAQFMKLIALEKRYGGPIAPK